MTTAPLYFKLDQANKEGWTIKVDADGVNTFAAVNGADLTDVLDYVIRKAGEGYDYHIKALKIVLRGLKFLDRDTMNIETDWGNLTIDFESGAIIKTPDASFDKINRIDVEEFERLVGDKLKPTAIFNLKFFGRWEGETYIDPQPARTAYVIENGVNSNWLTKAFAAEMPQSGQHIVVMTLVVAGDDADNAWENLESSLGGSILHYAPTFSRHFGMASLLQPVLADEGSINSEVMRQTLREAAPGIFADSRAGRLL